MFSIQVSNLLNFLYNVFSILLFSHLNFSIHYPNIKITLDNHLVIQCPLSLKAILCWLSTAASFQFDFWAKRYKSKLKFSLSQYYGIFVFSKNILHLFPPATVISIFLHNFIILNKKCGNNNILSFPLVFLFFNFILYDTDTLWYKNGQRCQRNQGYILFYT